MLEAYLGAMARLDVEAKRLQQHLANLAQEGGVVEVWKGEPLV